MPWPCNFEYILGGVDITIFNVATGWTDMRTDAQGLLDDLTTPIAFLRGIARVHSDHLMSSTCSLGFEDIEERAPRGIHDAFCEMVVLDHAVNVQLLNGNMLIGLGILPGNLIVKVPALPLDLEVSLCGAPCSFPSPRAPLVPTGYGALLTPKRLLLLAVVVRIVDCTSFGVRQEGLQPNIDPNSRVLTHHCSMLCMRLNLTDNQGIPMPIGSMHEVSRLRCPFKRMMQFDFDRTTQFLGDDKMLPTRGKLEVHFMLSELNGVPSIRLFEPGEPYIRNAQLTGSKKALEGLTQAIREHLDRGSRHVFPSATGKLLVQIVLRQERAILLILCLECCKHLIVELSRLAQACHEQTRLLLSRVEAVFKRFHALHFTRDQINSQVAEVSTHPPLPQVRNAASIAAAKAGGTRRFDKRGSL